VSAAAGTESRIAVPIVLDSLGNESSISFSLSFNPAIVGDPVVSLGSGAPAGLYLEINSDNLAQGRLGIRVGSITDYSAGTRNIVMAAFTVSGNPIGSHMLEFGSVPTAQGVSSATGESLPTTFTPGVIAIGTADGAAVTGRIVTPDGRGIRNVAIIATDTNGIRRMATTSSFGYYSFPYVTLGRTFTFSVQSKRYRFTPRVIQIADSLADFDFVGQE
jgi:hypothetical protein